MERLNPPELSVVIPLFNEESVLPELHRRLSVTLSDLGSTYEILFVDDGSVDATPHLLDAFHALDPHVVVVRLSRNFGHQAAISAGIDHAIGSGVVVMDGDLQDPPELIPQFVERWRAGSDVVYAVRASRQESWPKRLAYTTFYRLWKAVSDLDVPLNSGDFGLMDRKVVDALKALPERTRFVRGLRSFVGFRQTGVAFDRPARLAGKPKFTPRKLAALAADGLVSFSGRPLRLVTALGLSSAAVSLALTAWVLLDALTARTAPRGWASLITVVLFMASVQLISLGIVGEYVRLIFLEAKQRPTYILNEHKPSRVSSNEVHEDHSERTDAAAVILKRKAS